MHVLSIIVCAIIQLLQWYIYQKLGKLISDVNMTVLLAILCETLVARDIRSKQCAQYVTLDHSIFYLSYEVARADVKIIWNTVFILYCRLMHSLLILA